jgi:hypothetical protein
MWMLILCVCLNMAVYGYGKAENIALGKNVIYSIAPEEPADNPGSSKLTDGKVNPSKEAKQKTGDKPNLVFDEQRVDYSQAEMRNDLTVGWSNKAMYTDEIQGVNLCIDLGEIQPLQKTIIRLASFTHFMYRFSLPCKISVLLSSDGINFYNAGTLTKASAYGNPELAANEKLFAIDEEDVDNWHSLEFDLSGLGARYVGLNIIAEGYMFYADEWFIERGTARNPEKENLLYTAKNRKNFPIGNKLAPKDALLFGPEDDFLSVATNMAAPQLFLLQDYRGGDKKSDIEYIMELPVELTLCQTPNLIKEYNITEKTTGAIRRYELKPRHDATTLQYMKILQPPLFGPLYFLAADSVPPKSTASFFCRVNGKEYSKRIASVKTFVMPTVKADFPFFAAITWMTDYESMEWPNLLDNYTQIGFNSYPTHPYYWKAMGEKNGAAQLAEAKKRNLKIINNESPLHLMDGLGEASACKYKGATGFCPSYRGGNYKKEMKRIGENCAKVQPDYVFWDIELIWEGSIKGNPKNLLKCERCAAEIKKTGKTPEAYLLDCGTEIHKDLYQTAAANIKKPFKVGHYDVFAQQESYQSIWRFSTAYPQYIQLSMPAAYTAGLLAVNHWKVREDYLLLKKKWLSTSWITARTYGHCEPFKLEPMVYEQVLNGGNVNFFQMKDFSPLKLYYVALALQNLSHFEILLKNGTPDIDFAGNNPKLCYSRFAGTNESLILIANYTSAKEEKYAINLSSKKARVTVISPAGMAAEVKQDKYEGALRPAEFVLLHICQNPE